MNILFICESFPTTSKADFTGGVEARDFYTAKQLAKHHQVTVITGARVNSPNRQRIKGIDIIRCGKKVVPANREDLLVRSLFICTAIKIGINQTYDIVQGSNVVSQTVAGMLGLLKKTPAVSLVADVFLGNWVTNTNLFTGLIGECIERLVLRFPWSKFIAVSQTTKSKLISVGIKPSRIEVIYAGLEHTLYRDLTHRKYAYPTITFAGRLVDYKRVQDLIRASSLLVNKIPALKVKIIGWGPKYQALTKLVTSLGLQDHVTFYGFLDSHKRVIQIIDKSHLFCSPSVVEGFGLTTIESMLCGTPVVLARTSVVEEITNHGTGALLAKPADPQDLAEKIATLLTNSQLYLRKAKQARQFASRFDWKTVAGRTATVFGEVLDLKNTTSKRLNIALLTEFFPSGSKPTFSGGVEARTYFIHKYLKRNHRVAVISRDKKFVAVSSLSIFPRITFQFSAWMEAIKTDFDVIEGSNVTCYLPAFVAAKIKGKPAVAWIPDIYQDIWFKNFKFIPAMSGYLLEKISLWLPWNHIIAMSLSTKDKLLKAGVDSKRISVVYGGVEIEKLKKLSVVKFTQPTIITLARLVKYKRVQDLIKALVIVNKEIPKARLLILGDGPYRPELEKLATKLGLGHNVHFKGNLDHDKAMRLLKKSTLFSLPSIVEGFGLVTVEAMASSVPYINSDIKPTKEITESGVGGLLFPAKNYRLLANNIVRLLTDKSLYNQKIKEGLRLVEKYEWQHISDQTEQVYKKVLS